MDKTRFFIWIVITLLVLGCSNQSRKNNIKQSDNLSMDNIQPSTDSIVKPEINITSETHKSDSIISLLQAIADTSTHHFSFSLDRNPNVRLLIFTGYKIYSDDEFEFNNPAYLKVFKNNSLIFNDSFSGYEEIRFNDFSGCLLNDSISFFSLTYGTEACDFINPSRLYYVINEKIGFIEEFYSQSTDYASKSTEFVFPTDSGGLRNHIVVIEKIDYRTDEEPNKADTSFYKYKGDKFVKSINN
ncbi:MAG: hypothetical protein GY870_09030 [archaeon]|nr:hypothetical protein [archaeon]